MKYVAYYRVSTQKQGRSGLGLEAQERSVKAFAKDGQIVKTFCDIESGKKDNRPELEKALRHCRLTGATLLIAKLDRLSRNAAFLMNLRDSQIEFVAADMPNANNFTVGIMACLAEYERELISERTKAALKAAKERGVKLGNPNLKTGGNPVAARQAKQAKAKERNQEVLTIIDEIKSEWGDMTLQELADQLNEAGYKTARGCEWQPMSVSRVLKAA